MKFIKNINKINKVLKRNNWEDANLNILIPMAGAGSRFEKAGYTFPTISEIHGKTIQWVLDGLGLRGNYIFIIRKNIK